MTDTRTLIGEARARIAGRVTVDARNELVGKGASLATRWDGLPIEQKRAHIRAVVEHVTIAPTRKANNRFDGTRISVLWRA